MKQLLDALTETIIGSAISVHERLGPGLLESAYESCLTFELVRKELKVERQKPMPLVYDGEMMDVAYRLDLLVNTR